MKYILITFLMSLPVIAFANSIEQELFSAKVNFEKEAFELKLLNEQELIRIKGKKNFTYNLKQLGANAIQSNSECIAFVYSGSASREEAVEACRGVSDIACVKFVYQGASSREESARAPAGGFPSWSA